MTDAGTTHRTTSEAETERLGGALASGLRAGDVVALVGELGAGKTRFVRGLVRGLGGDGAGVSSPTFVLMHEYPLPAPVRGIEAVVHIDAYRLSPAEGLASAGIESARDPSAVTVIEWADRVRADLPAGAVPVTLRHGAGADERVISLGPGPTLGGMFDEKPRPEPHESPADGSPPCPICGGAVGADAESAPFCSARCRMVDLGRWLDGGYVISRELKDADLEQGE